MAQDSLSLIPYPADSHEIILRRGSAVVLYDERSKQISLRKSSDVEDLETCPYCSRPFQKVSVDTEDESPPDLEDDHGFMNPSYFRLLQHSTQSSHPSSRTPSPRLRLVQIQAQSSSPTSSAGYAANPPPASHKIPNNAIQQDYFSTFFVEERELGRGGKGVVLLVRHVIDGVDLGRFACKRIPVGDDSEWLKKVLVEVQLLSNLSHANLVSYRHVWLENMQLSAFSPAIPHLFILQQHCNAGDLHQYIFGSVKSLTKEDLKQRVRTRSMGSVDASVGLRSPRRLQFEEIFSFFKDITSGLHYLHQEGYIHRDLKPSNCLLHKTGGQIRVLVSDFGEMQSTDAIRRSTGTTGTISFCAPEVLQHESAGVFGNFSKKSDIFSLGLIVHLMCFGRLPYASADSAVEENEDVDQLREEISTWTGMNLEQRDRTDLPEKLYKFLKQLLSLDPKERPSTGDILHSIKTGSSLHDAAHRSGELDGMVEPAIRTTPDVLHSTGDPRRRPSTFPRTTSAETTDPRRPTSPRTRTATIEAVTKSDLILRRPSAELVSIGNGLPLSPRLLPAPAKRPSSKAQWLARPETHKGIKITLFCIKVWTCLVACHPVATKQRIALPLLGLAALDLTDVVPGLTASVMLIAVHIAALGVAQQTRQLCEEASASWKPEDRG